MELYDKRIHFFETHNSNKTIAAAEAPQQSYTMTAAVAAVTPHSPTTPPQHNPAITITTKFTLQTWRQEAGKANSLQQ